MKAYIKKIAYYLPERIEENAANRLTEKTGIYRRHICAADETALDLAVRAVNKLLAVGTTRESIDYLILCTQSPDYYLPTTACLLQHELGLPTTIGATDINLGCSGYVYGLGLAKGLIESEQAQNVLLVTAETYSKHINDKDNAVKPLFGDAAAATLITGEMTESNGIGALVYGTDGSGANKLIIPVGGMRNPYDKTELVTTTDARGNTRTNRNLYMNGSGIMKFALESIPPLVEKVLNKVNLSRENIDYYVFHQANKFMLDYLQEKCQLMDLPYWNDVREYGNTGSNSIPIALADMLKANDSQKLKRVMIAGFGVGLSMAGAIINLEKME